MELLISIFKLLAGVGMFLFAMKLVEEALKNLSGRNFKLFLQHITRNNLGAAAGGAIITAILQSSSMVSLMVLAFVGAGVFTMKNAMAIILGANLGTTMSSWIVATLGFRMNIEVLAYPSVFAGGLLLIIFSNRQFVKNLAYFLLGFGLLFIALSFMKTAMEMQVRSFDFSSYQNLSTVVFLIIGFLITLLVQSSSVTMALTLSALHAGAVGFAPAAAIVLGSETGTAIKMIFVALDGNATKKRVVLGHILFNVFLTVFAFIFLQPILRLIQEVFGIHDPLIGLVIFSSLINLLSIILFIPFLSPFTRFLELFFRKSDGLIAAYIGHANISEPETALDLFRKETAFFIHNAMVFNFEKFGIIPSPIASHPDFKAANDRHSYLSLTPDEKYHYLKQLQGELQSFYMALRVNLKDKQSAQLNQLISSVRSAMFAVKGVKDIGSNISNLSRSSKNIKFDFFMHHKVETEALYLALNNLIAFPETASFEALKTIYNQIQHNYSSALNNFYKDAQNAHLENLEITTAINFNRELFTSNKAMLMAVKDFLLNEKEAEEFNDISVYKT